MSRVKQAVVVGGGFAGLSAACYLQRAGYRTILLEKNNQVGGRAQYFEEAGFKFNLGPNWYVMPDIYEDFFKDFGYKPTDFYNLIKPDPAYTIFNLEGKVDAAPFDKMAEVLESIKPGDGIGFKRLVNRSKVVYSDFKLKALKQNWSSKFSAINPKNWMLLKNLPSGSAAERNSKFVKSKEGLGLLNFLSFFFGGAALDVSAAYSFLPYTIFGQGVWHPVGGFKTVLESFKKLALESGVEIYEGCEVDFVETEFGRVSAVTLKGSKERIPADLIVMAGDYKACDNLLQKPFRNYKDKFWNKKEYSASALLISLGLNTKIEALSHNNVLSLSPGLAKLSGHGSFYVGCPSKNDTTVCPDGSEILNIIVPFEESKLRHQDLVDEVKNHVYESISRLAGFEISEYISVEKVIGAGYFDQMFYATKSSAFGLTHTKKQIFWRRPKLKSKKLPNLFYAGQDTNPGTSVPLAITSGKLAAYSAIGKKVN